MSRVIIQDLLTWLSSLTQDRYPEDRLYVGSPSAEVTGVMVCWFANAGARQAARQNSANLIIAHEPLLFSTPHSDPGCPTPDAWEANRRVNDFYSRHGIAFVQSHRTLDAHCIPRCLGDRLGFPPPVVHEGYKGYEFTLVHDLPPVPFGRLAMDLKRRIGLPTVRTSACDPNQIVRRVGIGWGGASNSRNLQYMEILRRHGVEVVIGGEVEEYALEYYRESGMEWIELGHYATEIIGLEHVASEMAAAFPGLPVRCHRDSERMKYL
jgi:putative NIF3 family GTP cyclohydrolase 1 type 2